MPVYEYLCDKCGHEFEREQRITEDPVKTCPECRARKVRRLISRTAFVLKGSGWYSDLYSSSKPDKKDADSSGGEAPAAKTESGAEATAAKTGSEGGKADSSKKAGEKSAKKNSKKGKSTKAA